MTREDIIRMAREAGDDWEHTLPEDRAFIERFASLVAAAQREACAKVCEDMTAAWTQDTYNLACMDCAVAIRARGEP